MKDDLGSFSGDIPGVMAGFVDIVELLGVVPDEFDMDEGDGVVQVIHNDKRRLLMIYNT